MTPYIETFTGVRFQPLAPVVADIRVADIAHALGNQCRFSGHVRSFYSVAEHCVRVSREVERRAVSSWRSHALWGLLHDASEAYLVDLPTPLKSDPLIGTGYRAAEATLMRAVCLRFGLPLEMPGIVAEVDAALLVTEVRDLMFARPEHWAAYEHIAPLGERIVPWSPSVAAIEFRHRFNELTEET